MGVEIPNFLDTHWVGAVFSLYESDGCQGFIGYAAGCFTLRTFSVWFSHVCEAGYVLGVSYPTSQMSESWMGSVGFDDYATCMLYYGG
jgi:hypothetical protein